MFELSRRPPPWWAASTARHRATTLEVGWLKMLENLGPGYSLFLCDDGSQDGTAIRVFRKGILSVGYVGFPLGLKISGRPLSVDEREHAQRLVKAGGVDLLLTPCGSTFAAEQSGGVGYSEPESVIENLQRWSAEGTPGRRTQANIRRATRLPAQVREANLGDEVFLHKVHVQTVKQHRGTARYSAEYFHSLVRFCHEHPLARTWIVAQEGADQSFTSVVIHGPMAVYLHGGYDRGHGGERPVDLGLLHGIEWARDSGAEWFNMQRSPRRQPGLTAYKEKWGGVKTGPHLMYVHSRYPGLARLVSRSRGGWRDSPGVEGGSASGKEPEGHQDQ